MKYLYPCKPNPLAVDSPFLDELDKDVRWIGEIKKNGWRCLVHRERGLTLWTRHKTIITEPLEALRDSLMAVPDNCMLDGELLHFRTQDIKGVLYLFDILVHKGRQITELPLADRRKILEEVAAKLTGIELARQVRVGKKALYYSAIETPVNEGIVLKKLDSKYLFSEKRCPQNPFWLKVKRPEAHVYVGKD
jgi:ATP-dependent DNA ligase